VRWNDQRKEWAHAAALILCTPDGRVSRYLYGITYEPKTLRLSLVEASEGKVGTTIDRVLLFCYHYDGTGYSMTAMNVVRAAGLLTLLAVGGFLALLWWRERRRRPVASTAV
jgi:protein SCO1